MLVLGSAMAPPRPTRPSLPLDQQPLGDDPINASLHGRLRLFNRPDLEAHGDATARRILDVGKGGCRRRAPRSCAGAAVWSLQTIILILVYVVFFRCPAAVLRSLGVRNSLIAGPARGPRPAAETLNVWSGHHAYA